MRKASVIFLKNHSKVLLLLRDDKEDIPYPNYWSLLGGGINNNETPEEAIKREVNEEIGCNIKNINFIKKFEITNDPLCEDRVIFLFKGEVDKRIDEINLTEGQKLAYFDFEEFKNLKFTKFLKDFIIEHKEEFF